MSASLHDLYSKLPPEGFEPDLYAGDDEYEYRYPKTPSLEEVFRTEGVTAHTPKAGEDPVVEITELCGGAIHEPFVLRVSKESYVTDDKSLTVLIGLGGGAIQLADGVVGTVRRRGRADAEETALGPTTVVLAPTDAARFKRGESMFFVRAFHPEPPREIRRPAKEVARIWTTVLVSILVAGLIHMLYGQGIYYAEQLSERDMTVDKPEKERFADVKLLKEKVQELKKTRPIKLKKPKPKPKPKMPDPELEKMEPIPKDVEPVEKLPEKLPEVARKDVAERISAARVGRTKSEALVATLQGKADPNAPRNTAATIGGINVSADAGAGGTALPAIGSPGGEGSPQFGDVTAGGKGVATKGRGVAGKAGKVIARKGRNKVVRGKVRPSKHMAKVKGSLSKAEVYDAIQRRARKIQGCYERALLRKPTLAGKISFSWTITMSGGVSGLRVKSSTIADASVSKCIIGVLKRIRFPKPTGAPVPVSFPFLFKAAPT